MGLQWRCNMKKAWSIVSILLIALLGVTSVICVKGVFEALVSRQVDDWLSDQPTIFTSQLTDRQKDSLVAELQNLANKGTFTAISLDNPLLHSVGIFETPQSPELGFPL